MKTLKVSAKMRNAIKSIKKEYGKLKIDYFQEKEGLRRNEKYYDGADLYCRILNKRWTVNFDGEIF